MLILPKRVAMARPTATFYLDAGRVVFSSAATKKIDAKFRDRIAVEIDEKSIKFIFRHDGFVLSKKTGNETMLHINSKEVCNMVREFYSNQNEKTVSFLIGTRENNIVEVITSSKKTLK